MYHELTEQKKQHRKVKRMLGILLALVLFGAAWFGFSIVSKNLSEQSELSLKNSIMNSAKQCCAIEGSYPASLSYLEENYGLVVNHDRYVITYEIFAENVMPSVVVIAKP